ncbi:ATP-binding cassette domain-containing protein [Pseudarthrobacter phenanthrenivorans]|uniref:ATP-binding cassette domain-containing protein n=2 Tax=Pseudarthrobacter phenanthrenivorans TaxID=361575 RepID=A0A3B0FR19_PSEPS|nr:ATP-binding cassette domain-containing protein [Pseudarthrobacter phenanthrenivorans]ADX74805.1 ATPase component of various ABC-type transport systems with duplicated ATPase domain [Pseudarthrobacter phenanthrenivorans Sphe3]RKO22058.1 ATP-binding cassette domain-containing protein [Pseudarthrobacter phenanthrenivorans]TPV50667.1 energy-coupling factor ABC transporter ATP-binding protein [Pseudarthrobacter phenanthrenivorans]
MAAPTRHDAPAAVRPAAVSARGWGWRHAGRSTPAVQALELDILPGERVLLLGPSGAGKSTLLHALAGVLGDADDDGGAGDSDESGSLLVDGASPREQRGRAGLMQQDPETQVVLSRVGDDVAFGAENLAVPRDAIWARVHEALDDVGLSHLPLDHPTSALSGGQKQRLALAGILAMRPGLILLDEPTANLDPAGVLEVRDAVARCLDKTGATLVVVEHRVSVWKDLVDRIVVLQPGSATEEAVLLDGPPDQVLADARSMLIAAGVWVPGYVPDTRPRGQEPAAGAGSLLLAAENLAVSRERARRTGFRKIPPVPVQEGISAQVRAGQALAITGPNGAGKSTFALTLAGLLEPAAGKVSATLDLSRGAGIDPYKWKAEVLIERIGTVFQEPEHQFVTGNVLDELRFGPRHLGHGGERVDELLERLRLAHLVDANPYTLSGGEKRRLSVATVLAAHPQVLVLDEPTFGQDANTWAELASFLSELLDAGTAVVSVTHDAEFTAALGGTELRMAAAGQVQP